MTDKPDSPRSRNIKLTDLEWAALERIARANGLEWGGVPSRSDAVRLMIREWARPRQISEFSPEFVADPPREAGQ